MHKESLPRVKLEIWLSESSRGASDSESDVGDESSVDGDVIVAGEEKTQRVPTGWET
jgi:hypothetical protein